jgi:hypothetical protein
MGLKGGSYDFLRLDSDRDLNLLYVQINPTIRTGITRSKKEVKTNTISNLAIYEIGKDKLSYFFEKGSMNNIKYYFYETSYNEQLERMDFSMENHRIFNNKKIEKRELADKLFLVNENEESDELELWVASKLGADKKIVKVFSKNLDWRIDVYNKKVLFFHKIENGIKVESIDW